MDRHHLRLLIFAAAFGFALEAAAFITGSAALFAVAIVLLAVPLVAGIVLALHTPGGRSSRGMG